FSSDGKYIASGSDDLTVCLWSVETGMQVAQPYKEHIGKVNAVSFSPDGRYIASGSTDHTVHLWDVENGMPVGEPYEGHTDFINTVSFSPDGRYIASGSDDQTIHLWSVDTGMPVAQPYEGHTDWVNSVLFSPDGKHIDSGSGNQTAFAWNVEVGMQAVHPHSLLLHEFPTGFFLLASNGWLVTRTGNRVLWIPFDLQKGLFMPGTSCIFSVKSMVKIDLTRFHLGKEWGVLVESIMKGKMPASRPLN
ncbi:hypothetical protein M422DRAFT_170084, partial [Sphaerobolus stellatus SS14]